MLWATGTFITDIHTETTQLLQYTLLQEILLNQSQYLIPNTINTNLLGLSSFMHPLYYIASNLCARASFLPALLH